jgi:apolipoprotein N-acyltransferase
MEFDGKVRTGLVALAAFLATAGLVFFGNGLMPRWPLMWFAPLPVLLFALRRPAWQASIVAFAAMAAGFLNLWGYFRVLGAPPVAWFSACGMITLAFAAGVLLLRALAGRGAVWSAWIAFPALCVTFEFVRNFVWPHGSGASLAYSQLNFVPFLQTASLAGPWGMTFVLMLFPAGLALGMHLWGSARGQAVRILGATAGVVGALLIFGAVRMSGRQPGPQVRVGVIASDAGRNWIPPDPGAPAEQLFTHYAQQAETLFARGAQVVVIPENLGVVTDATIAKTDAIFQPVVDRTGAMLVAGMNHITDGVAYNEARVYTGGAPVRSYDKQHLLPPFENRFTPGDARLVFNGVGAAANDRWGTAICKDMDFTDPARGYGRADVGLMLVPGWDFTVDAFWHGHIAIMRGVEDGFSLVRAAKHSTLFVADDRGRVIAETASGTAPFATAMADVPAGHDSTLFQMWGDWFGWCAIALLLVVVGRLVVVRRPVPAAAATATLVS